MTGTQEVDNFVAALDNLIESASSHVRNPDAFLSINKDISNLVESGLPPLVEALDAGELEPAARELLKERLASVRELEMKARARLVWSRDFEDYIRVALSENG
jgi:hypothetical protein